jgi:hypothetical protein
LNFNRADETRGYVERVSICPVTLIVQRHW